MKIMFNISSLAKGGAERVVSILANRFVERNNDVSIIVNTTKNMAYKLNASVKLIELDKKIINNSIIKNIMRIKSIKNSIKLEEPDVIISFLPIPSFKILFANIKTRVPIIISDRNNPNQEYKGVIEKILMRWLYPKANGFVFQTKEQASYFNKKIQNKSVIIFNPIKEEFLLERQNEIIRKENTILSVGRLVSQKNHKLLIKSFSNISKDFEDYKLKIYGEGVLKDELQEQINSLHMEDKIELCGVSHNIREELMKAKMFVMSSIYEGMPNALMEAMAVGLPVISTDCPCGGPKELIKDKVNGILIPINDEKMLEYSIKLLINNTKYAEELGKKAKKSVKGFNQDSIIDQWEKFIRNTIKDNKF